MRSCNAAEMLKYHPPKKKKKKNWYKRVTFAFPDDTLLWAGKLVNILINVGSGYFTVR
jgi:hypothetical protein